MPDSPLTYPHPAQMTVVLGIPPPLPVDTDGTVTTLLWVLLVVAVAFMLLHLAPKLVEFYEMARAVLAALRSEHI